MRGVWIAAMAGAAAGLAACYLTGGARGLVIAATGLAVLALLVMRAAIAPAAGPRPARRKGKPPSVREADFPAYRKIASDVAWAGSSRRHYDHALRPLLRRLLGSLLAERHRLDLARHPNQARLLVGEDLWPLVDPSRPPSEDGDAPGVDLATLSRMVDRLEGL
jgi:hypothetical protein